MKNFVDFLASCRDKIYALAEQNTQRNAAGDTVISRDDPWFYDDVWDNDYKELVAHDDNPTARSLVC